MLKPVLICGALLLGGCVDTYTTQRQDNVVTVYTRTAIPPVEAVERSAWQACKGAKGVEKIDQGVSRSEPYFRYRCVE